jgi:hypothetical protein
MDLTNWVCISDIHAGDRLGICPPNGVPLDEGGFYYPSPIQVKMWAYWEEFWKEWVPMVTRKEPYGIIINGDTTDGRHHGSVHQISQNLSDQANIAELILAPRIENKKCKALYMIRGTEAHVGQSGENEEQLARKLGAIPNELGQYARYDLWKRVGNGLVHFLHHIGTTGSNAYEATAPNKELTEEFNESARWSEEAPSIVIRSHRHRHIKIAVPTMKGEAIVEVTPGWQAKTPFVWKIPGGRLAPPQFGGVVIRQGDEELYTRAYVRTIGRSRIE